MLYQDFVNLALALPGVVEATSYGTPSLKVGRKFLARLREDDILVLTPVDDFEKRMLMETQPDTYFVTDHYRGYPAILIRLSTADPDELRDLLERCWFELATTRLRAQREPAAIRE